MVGGCRSGKSSFALGLAEEAPGERLFIATAPVFDDEMAERVRRHREERAGRGWRTVEEEIALAGALAGAEAGAVVLIDCLTVWIGNLMHRCEREGLAFPDEADIVRLAGVVIDAARARDGTTVMISNEVGLGIVPDNAMARRFRDLAGRVNQVVAARTDETYFMTCGLPTRIK